MLVMSFPRQCKESKVKEEKNSISLQTLKCWLQNAYVQHEWKRYSVDIDDRIEGSSLKLTRIENNKPLITYSLRVLSKAISFEVC